MYKKASDQTSFLERVASHATKEHATGRIDAIPSWAREPEDYFNSLRERVERLRSQLTHARDKLGEVNTKLTRELPYKEYQIAQSQRLYWSDMVRLLHAELGNYHALMRAAASNSWAIVFHRCAELVLDAEMMARISRDADAMLKRQRFEGARATSSEKLAEMTEDERVRALTHRSEKNQTRKRGTEEARQRDNRQRKLRRKKADMREQIGPRWIKIDGEYRKIPAQ